jgi:hypothetical protein
MGAPAKSGRIAYGALLIKERLKISDEETVEQILEKSLYLIHLRWCTFVVVSRQRITS